MKKELRSVVISGGGTGGHIFPALSIANEIKHRYPQCRILFVGAYGRMEAERVPAAGYEIMLLKVQGLSRGRNIFNHFKTAWMLWRSMRLVRQQLKVMMPQVAVGVGGYVSAPTLLEAQKLGIPTLVQEQNSYAGKANKLVGRKAKTVCVAYKGMERFFPKAKRIILAGNPVRMSLLDTPRKYPRAYEHFAFDPHKKTLLILGGSLGARTINESVASALEEITTREELQVIWQCGKYYIEEMTTLLRERGLDDRNILLTDFISQMDYAYSIADLVISRAGASSISELCLLGLPVILVPSPNVAEDHQTQNAMALVREDAAVLIPDSEAREKLMPTALDLLSRPERLQQLSEHIQTLALPNAAQKIVDEIEHIVAEAEQ